jgi:hypothetical protein
MKLYLLLLLLTICSATTCVFQDSTVKDNYYLSINGTLDCSISKQYTCFHTFVNHCPTAFEWVGQASRYCDGSCCVDTLNSYHTLSFTCQCEPSNKQILNYNLTVITEECSPSSSSLISISYLLLAILLMI